MALPARAKNLGLLLVSTLAALVAGELLFALLGLPRERAPRAAHPPGFVEVRDFLEFGYRFETNSGGLRYREVPRRRPPGVRRVLVLGDSYVEGLGVETGDRFTERLERALGTAREPVELVNGGLSGTGPLQYARLLEHVGLAYEPQGVLVCLFANDVANTFEDPARIAALRSGPSRGPVKGFASRWFPRIYTLLATTKARWSERRHARTSDFVGEVSSQARARGIPQARIDAWAESLPPEIVGAVNEGRFGFGVLSYGLLYPEFWVDALDIASPKSEAKWENMLGALEGMVALAGRAGVEVAVAYLPVHFQYDPATHAADNLAVRTGTLVRDEWLAGPSEVETRLAHWAAQRGIAFVSLTEAFRAAVPSDRPLDFALDGHWTPAGHEVAAGALARWLRGGGVFSFLGRSDESADEVSGR